MIPEAGNKRLSSSALHLLAEDEAMAAGELDPGLMIWHGNQLEDLRDVLAAWLRRQPRRRWKTKSSWCKARAWASG